MSCKAAQTKTQTVTPAESTGKLQRKCEKCGQHSMTGTECPSCSKTRLQRQSAGRTSHSEAPPIVHDVLGSPGRPLDAGTRAMFEPRFGRDFSHVRVHTDQRAAQSARAVDALAYTVGNNIVFGAGQHQPGTRLGNAVLAHELTHVVQQGRIDGVPSSLKMGPSGDSHEAEADRNAAWQMTPRARVPFSVPGQTFPQVQRLSPVAVGAAALAGFIAGFGIAWAIDYLSMTKARSERFANELDTKWAGWLDTLLKCPCDRPGAKDTDWINDPNPNLQDYHPGASYSYRQANPVNRAGQQCTYDAKGKLITSGPGAGTPDFYSPSSTINIPYHVVYDVKTWKELGWSTYTKTWKPDNRNNCPANSGASDG